MDGLWCAGTCTAKRRHSATSTTSRAASSRPSTLAGSWPATVAVLSTPLACTRTKTLSTVSVTRITAQLQSQVRPSKGRLANITGVQRWKARS